MFKIMQAWKILLCLFLLEHFIFVEGISQVYSSIPSTSFAAGWSVVSKVKTLTSNSLSPASNMSSSMANHTTASVSLSPASNMSSSMANHTIASVSLSPVSNMSLSSSMANHTTISVSLSPVANMSSSITNHTVTPTSALLTSHQIIPTLPVNSTTSMVSTVIPTFSPNINISSTSVITSSVMPSSSAVPTPTPTPTPPFGNYSVKNTNGSSCVLASLSVKFDVTYTNVTSEKKVTASGILLPIEQNVETGGYCPQEQESSISLMWPKDDPKYNFTLVFYAEKHGNGTNGQVLTSWSTKFIEISINMTDNSYFQDAEAQTIALRSSNPVKNLNATYGHAVQCNHQISISDLKDTKNTVNATVHFEKLEIQPFDVPPSGKFGKADDCEFSPSPSPTTATPAPAKSNSNTVAIAVGCTLGGLVLIVIIGYLIGRRRGRRATSSAGYRKL